MLWEFRGGRETFISLMHEAHGLSEASCRGGIKQRLAGWDVDVGRVLHMEARAGAGHKNFRLATKSSMEK